MLQQARDLLDEGIEFKALLDTLTAQDWETPTPFKSWTINQIVQHLHGSDKMAVLSLKGREGFESTVKDRKALGSTMNPTQTGQQLLDDWWSYFQEMCELLGASDPKRRLAWFVRTYGWTFANRQAEPPGPAPYVKLTSPSGQIWEFNEPSADNYVAGDAAEFCHVVTQGRNIADVHLTVVGEPATQWMAIAQCFAGPPENPPAPGTRSSYQ